MFAYTGVKLRVRCRGDKELIKMISGESGNVREETGNSGWKGFQKYWKNGRHKAIWNKNEIGQFFRAGWIVGGRITEFLQRKKANGRLTCSFFVNASGGKEKPIHIGKSSKPRCFKGIRDINKLPRQYYTSVKPGWRVVSC